LFSTVWLDVRTASTVDEVLAGVRDHNQDCLKSLCGLPVSTYFSAVKVRWLMDNVSEVKQAFEDKRCCFGTIDTWLLWVSRELSSLLNIQEYLKVHYC
jgi:glycerol kinase